MRESPCGSLIPKKTNPDIEDILEFTKKDNQKKTLGQSLEILKEELVARGLYRVYEEIELPIVPIIKKPKRGGILVDAMYFKKLAGAYRGKLKEFERKYGNMPARSSTLIPRNKWGLFFLTSFVLWQILGRV